MSKKSVFTTVFVLGLCFLFQNIAFGQNNNTSTSKEFLEQIEKNKNDLQKKMFQKNQKNLAKTDSFTKDLATFQKELNKAQQTSVLKTNSLSSDMNQVRANFQSKMFQANQKQIMKGNALQKQITEYQGTKNKATQSDIKVKNKAGLSGNLGSTLTGFQEDMFKDNMKKFQSNMFKDNPPPINVTTAK